MSADKKIIDDYYSSQNQIVSKDEKKVDNKPKFQIKGKIKIKKTEEKVIKKEAKEEKLETKIKEVSKPVLETHLKGEKNTNISLEDFEKKQYFTKKGLERKEKFKDSAKKPFNKFSKDKPVFSKENEPNVESKSGAGFKKEGGYSTGIQNKEGGFRIGETKKENKFFVKNKYKFDNKKEEEEKGKKFFKKDKSNKYVKNIFIDEDEDFSFSRSTKIKHIKKEEKKVEDIVQNLTDRTGETVVVNDILSVKELSEKTGIPLIKLITEFLKNGMKVNINSKVDFETAAIVCDEFQIKLQKDMSAGFGVEDILTGNISTLLAEDDNSLLEKRPPVVSIMGHVDHGKTSLLDYLRKTKVALKEAGGITQSIGAYQVYYKKELITFLDTPGHEAFTIMRARGAKSTDIAILVVAADEGVKSQTIESINHAREADIKIIVAITKIDKEGANIDNVKSGLSSYGLVCEDWGGDIPMIPVSSKTGAGIDDLLEHILFVAEDLNLKANPNRSAVGTIIESHLDMKLGPVSSVLINTGTLKKGDSIVCKGSYGKVKLLKNDHSKNIEKAGPGTPVLVVGLDSVSDGGDIVQVVSDIEKARTKALEYKELIASKKALSSSSIDLIMSKIKSGNLKQLKLVLKTDSNGSLEALKGALFKLSTPEIKITIIHSGVGNITEGDVVMCGGSSAILIGFNVELLGHTKNIIEDMKIEFISSKVIYHITERIEKIISGMLDPREVEISLGEAVVGGIFYVGEGFMILGLKLKEGSKIEKGYQVKIIRKDKFLGNGKIENLKSGMIDVNYVEGPTECGIKLKTDVKIELGDILEIYKTEIHK